MELALGIRKLGRQRGKQALPSLGTLFGWCQRPATSGWLLLRVGGDTEARGGTGSMPTGTAAAPTLPRAGTSPPHCTPSFSILRRKTGFCFKLSLSSSAPGGRAGIRTTASLSPPPGRGSLRALTQNLGSQHERLKNLWVLRPRNQIFCLINP